MADIFSSMSGSTGQAPSIGGGISAHPGLNPANWNFGGGGTIDTSNVPKIDPNYRPLLSSISNTPPQFTKTATGGTSFSPSIAKGYGSSAITQNPTTQTNTKPNLSSFVIQNTPTQGGGTISTVGGNPTGYTPNSGYSINTDSPVGSDALSSTGNPFQKHQTLQDYVDAVSQAQGYNPEYLNALQSQYGTQAQGALLGVSAANYGQQGARYGVNSAAINNQAFGANTANGGAGMNVGGFGGATTDYIGGIIQGEQSQNAIGQAQNTLAASGNTVQQALNAQQATQAGINLNTQQLARTGNIASAQAQLQYSPSAVTQQNAIAQYNALQQAYPSANLPPINPQGDLYAQLQAAHQTVAQSPAYQAQFQSTYSTPGGGTGIYNKLNTGGLTQNPDGTLALVSGAAASLGSAQASSLNTQIGQYNAIAAPYKAANDDFTAMTNFMQTAGINNSQVPIINQIQNNIKAKTLDAGALGAFQSYITSLRTNYSQLLGSRGETPTQAGQDAAQLIPDNLSIKDMQKVQQALNTNGNNILSATRDQISQILGGIQGGTNATQTPTNIGGTSGRSVWSF